MFGAKKRRTKTRNEKTSGKLRKGIDRELIKTKIKLADVADEIKKN